METKDGKREAETRVMAIDIETYSEGGGRKSYRVAGVIYDSDATDELVRKSDINHWQASGVLLKPGKDGALHDLVTLYKSFFAWYNDWRPTCHLTMSPSSARVVSQFFAGAFATGYLGGRMPTILEGLEVEGKERNVIYVCPEASGPAATSHGRAEKAAKYCARMLAEMAAETEKAEVLEAALEARKKLKAEES